MNWKLEHCKKCNQMTNHENGKCLKCDMGEIYDTTGIPEEFKKSIGFLRQWLNEDRHCTPMVTSKEIWVWFEEDFSSNQIDL